MPRPRKDNPEEKATFKIETTFWRLLEEEGYSEITVRRISQESGTNRNSFYYHYTDIEDLARKAFAHNASGEAADGLRQALLAQFQGEGNARMVEAAVLPHSRRIMLCARSESPFLCRLVRDLLQGIWFDALAINGDALSAAERLQAEFIFSGLVAALGSPEVKEEPLAMSYLAKSDIGQAAIATLKMIGDAKKRIENHV